MKTQVFMWLLGAASVAPAGAQTDAPPVTVAPADAATNAPPLTPEKIAEYQQRFQQGYALEQQGKLADARTIYDGILAEQPDAKRSLLEAGRISLELNEPDKADVYLERLHALVPNFPEGYELLIQANQALKKDIKVERLVREFRELRDSGTVPFDSKRPFFEREHIYLDHGAEIVFTQFFDFTQAPYYALRAESFGPGHVRQHVLLLKYDPDATQALRAHDAAHAQSTVFIVAEPFFNGDQMTRIDVYAELLVVPEYMKARNLMLGLLAQPPKPIYSAPVDAAAQ